MRPFKFVSSLRSIGFMSAAAAAVLAVPETMRTLEFIRLTPAHQLQPGSKRRRTGRLYPHSSTRQQARYARQIAAGQLKMDGV